MVNYFGATQARAKTGGFLVNQFAVGDQQLKPTTTFGAAPVALKTSQDHWSVTLGKAALAAPVDVVDSMAAIIPGVERGVVNDSVYDQLGMPGFAAWVRENQGSVEIASGLLGALTIGSIAEKGAAKLLAAAWSRTSGVGAATNALTQSVGRAKFAATRAALAGAKEGKALHWLEKGAMRDYAIARTRDGLLKAAVSETAVVAALHHNSMIWGDDDGTNALFVGLGLGIGATMGGIGGRAVMTQWANREAMRGAFAGAADPGTYSRLLGQTPMGPGAAAMLSDVRGPIRTAEFTALMLDATRDDIGQVAKGAEPRVAARNQIQTGQTRNALAVLQTTTRKGVHGIGDSAFNIRATGPGAHIIETARVDPTVLFGATEVGWVQPGRNIDDLLNSRNQTLAAEATNKQSSNKERLLAIQRQSETPLFLVGNQWVTADIARAVNRFNPEDIKFRSAATGSNELIWQAPESGTRLILREDGALNRGLHELGLVDQLSVYHAMNQMIRKNPGKIVLPKSASWVQLDFARQAEKQGRLVDYSALGVKTGEEAEVLSLRMKSDIVEKHAKLGKPLDFEFRVGLNLPMSSTLEHAADPRGANLLAMIMESRRPGVTKAELTAARQQAAMNVDMGLDASISDSLSGDMFSFNRTKGSAAPGEWQPMIIATFENMHNTSFSRFDLGQMIVEQKALTLKMLLGKKNAPFTQMVTRAAMESPSYKPVSEVDGLANNQLGGTTNVVSATASQFVTQTTRFRHNPILQAAQSIRRVLNRITEVKLDEILSKLSPHTEAFTSVSGQRSRILFNQYASYAPGWDIEKAIPNGNGWVFQLRETEQNAARLGRPVQKGETLHSPSGVEVMLDDVANNARVDLEQQYIQLLKERNSIRLARGLEPVQPRSFYVPPPSTKGKLIGFTLDQRNRLVAGGSIVASNEADFKRMESAITARLKPGERFVTQAEVADFHDLWEQAMMEFQNPMDFIDPQSLAGPAKAQTGKLSSQFINPRAYEDALEFLKHGYEQATNGIVRTLFDAQLKTARVRHGAAVGTHSVAAGTKDVWQTYEETLLGISATANPKGLNAAVGKLEEFADSMLNLWPSGSVSKNHIADLLGNIPGLKGLRKGMKFHELADTLGPYMPFASAQAMAEYQYGLKAPWTTRDIARSVNRIGSGVVLRWLEMPHAIMNMIGIVTSLPLVAGAKNVPTIGRVGGVGILDVSKIMARGFKRQFERGTADWDMMVRNGDTSQDVAELHHQLSLLNGKTAFMKFMTGDPKFSDWEKLPNGALKSRAMLRAKGLEGMASIITDTSENMSRRWAHFVGLELADYHGITGMEARHNFARSIANEAIANYDPLNRPEIFQSAFGTMYGLFLSYAQNYYERMFRWMEAGDFKSVGRAMATQASLFGVSGLPGFRQVEALVGGEEDGDGLMDGIYKRYGPAVGSVVAQGGVNQIPTLFGLPPVSLHTRGDVNLRHPGIDFADGTVPTPVGIEVIKDIVTGIVDAASTMIDPNRPGSARLVAEVVARNMPSRALKGMLSLTALDGQEIDAFGNIISETKSEMEAAYRVLGLRSGRQQAQIEAYYMNQKALAIEAQKMAKVRNASRALIRSGQMDQLPKVFEDYVAAGGVPWNYPEWIEGLIEEAKHTRAENQLLKALRSPSSQMLAERIMRMTNGE